MMNNLKIIIILLSIVLTNNELKGMPALKPCYTITAQTRKTASCILVQVALNLHQTNAQEKIGETDYFYWPEKKEACLGSLFVQEQYRKNGHGRMLFQYTMNHILDSFPQCTKIFWIAVDQDNPCEQTCQKLIQFYKKNNSVIVERPEESFARMEYVLPTTKVI